MLQFLKNKYTILLEFIKPNVWILNCKGKSTNKPVKILYIGTDREQAYFIRTTFDDNYHKESMGRMFFWRVYYMLNNDKYNCSLAVIEGTFLERYLYRAVKDFFVPFWTYTVADLPLAITKKAAKYDMRKVQKSKLEYFVTEDMEMAEDFYYNMHMPMIQTRYEAGTYEFLYDDMIKTMKKESNKLLCIKKEDVFISGGILLEREEIPELWKNGIRDFKYWEDGAIAATYVFASEYFSKKGYEKISFGLVRSFLNDGLLKYKKKWNITLKVSNRRGFILKPLVASDEVEDFFINNPFIYMKKNKLFGAVFINENEDYTQEDYKKLKKQHYIKGMSELNIFSIKKRDQSVSFTGCINKVPM